MSFMQKWSLLLRKLEKAKVDALKTILIRRVQEFRLRVELALSCRRMCVWCIFG
jgi:hypothetical protein